MSCGGYMSVSDVLGGVRDFAGFAGRRHDLRRDDLKRGDAGGGQRYVCKEADEEDERGEAHRGKFDEFVSYSTTVGEY